MKNKNMKEDLMIENEGIYYLVEVFIENTSEVENFIATNEKK